MGILWESHGNWTKIEPIVGMEMEQGLDGNGNDPHSRGKLFPSMSALLQKFL